MILYSTGCPLCKTLEGRMKQAGISFTKITNPEEIMSEGFQTVPVLIAGGKIMYFSEAMEYVNSIIEKENAVNEDQHQTGS